MHFFPAPLLFFALFGRFLSFRLVAGHDRVPAFYTEKKEMGWHGIVFRMQQDGATGFSNYCPIREVPLLP